MSTSPPSQNLLYIHHYQQTLWHHIYIGVTNNLKRRTTEHRLGKGGRFSSRYHLKQLVYYESFYEIRKAIKREKQLKRWHRQWKINLIETLNPEWIDLYEML